MGITYGATPGTIITSFVMNETLPDQTQQSGNNTVVVSDSMTNLENGQIGDGTNGVGATYVGRLIIIDLGLSTQQVRMCTAETAGTGTTYILTVHEDWDTNPVITTDTIHVCYELADIEDGAASGGIGLGSKTGLWELSNDLTVGNATDPAGLQIVNGAALETDDNGAAINSYVENNGYLFMGYLSGGAPINGGVITAYNNANAEPWTQYKSGSTAYICDSLLWAQLVSQKLELVSGSDVTFNKSKIFSGTDDLHIFDATFINSAIGGRGGGGETVRVDAGTNSSGVNSISDIYELDTVADTTVETIELEGWVFSNVSSINIRQNKTWNMIDPIWDITTYSDLTWTGTSTGNVLNDRKSIKTTVQTAAGVAIQNALVIVYEGLVNNNLVLELVTDSDGYAEDSFIYKAHATNSTTTTYGTHALRVDKWLYTPFVATQTSTEKFNGTVTLISDSNIVQTTQATALTDGSGISWNEDTNPSSIISFTGGSGTLAVSDTITGGTSTADGIVTKIVSGDGTAGTIHLKTRDANDFSGTETLSNGIGWTATLTSGSQQDFSIWVDGNTKSMQTIYDYFAALTAETTLSATGELAHEWGRDAQGRVLYTNGTSFYTESSNSKGLFITNYGSGSILHYTDDTDATWTPPASVTLEINGVTSGNEPTTYARCRIEKTSDGTTIMNEEAQTSTGDGFYKATEAYNYTVDVPVTIRARYKGYLPFETTGAIKSTGLAVTAVWQTDPNYT